jgi:hypothetical protein
MIFHPAKSNSRQLSNPASNLDTTHTQWTQRLETQVGFGKKQRGLLVGNSGRVESLLDWEDIAKQYQAV